MTRTMHVTYSAKRELWTITTPRATNWSTRCFVRGLYYSQAGVLRRIAAWDGPIKIRGKR